MCIQYDNKIDTYGQINNKIKSRTKISELRGEIGRMEYGHMNVLGIEMCGTKKAKY